jgi:hypothetical protein
LKEQAALSEQLNGSLFFCSLAVGWLSTFSEAFENFELTLFLEI